MEEKEDSLKDTIEYYGYPWPEYDDNLCYEEQEKLFVLVKIGNSLNALKGAYRRKDPGLSRLLELADITMRYYYHKNRSKNNDHNRDEVDERLQ